MKNKFVFFLLLATSLIYSQQSSKCGNSTNVKQISHDPSVLMGCLPSPDGTWQIYDKDSIHWEPYNINGFETAVKAIGDIRYLQSFTEIDPTIPAYAKSLTAFSVIKSSTDPLYRPIGYVPAFLDITSKPTTILGYGITDAYPLTGNPSGFLTGITSGQVNTALGFSPINPNGTNLQYIAGDGSKITFPILFSGLYTDLLGKPTLATVSSTGSYTDLINKPTIPNNNNQLTNGAGYLTGITSTQITTALGFTPANSSTSGTVTSIGITSSDLSVSGSPVTSSGNITANLTTTGVSAGTYDNVTTDTKGRIISGYNKTLHLPARSLNSNFTISSTQDACVNYTIRISYNITILLGSTGTVTLQYSTNGGSTFTTLATISNSLNLGLALTGYNDFVLSGVIPAGAVCKLTSTTTNATNTLQTSSEYY